MATEMDFGSLNWDELEKNLDVSITKKKKSYNDDRFWTLSRNDDDTGVALIRLLTDAEGKPFIHMYQHTIQSFDSLQKRKRFYIEDSPETIGETCPASELWNAVYYSGTEEGKLEGKNFSRKIQYYANIKVITDPQNPQNEGKIFLWKFGPKLKDKFVAALNPSDDDRKMGEKPKELFNPINGCNIRLKIKKASGFFNYDDTVVAEPTPIYNSVEEAKKDIIENTYLLKEFHSPEHFTPLPELRKKLGYVLECYKTKHMDQELFDQMAAPIIGKNVEDKPSEDKVYVDSPVSQPAQSAQEMPVAQEAPVSQPAQSAQEIPVAQEAPVSQPAQPAQSTPTPPTTELDADLAFLDSI